MNDCPRCGLDLSDKHFSENDQAITCPNCGSPLSEPSPKWQTGWELIRSYTNDVWRILTSPSPFFRSLPSQRSIASALCFALVTHWIGTAIQLIWRLLFGGSQYQWIQSFFENNEDLTYFSRTQYEPQWAKLKELISDWMMGTGTVILDPFFTLFSILLTSLFVFIAARIFVSPGRNNHPREITYESAVKIISYGLTPSILSAFPFIGGFISSLYILIVTVIGAKVLYGVSTIRAFVIALFPKLLIFGIILLGIVTLAIAIVKVLTLAF